MTVTLGVPKVKPEVTAHYGMFLTGRTLKGSLFGGWKPKSDLPSLVDMYTEKVTEVMITLLAPHFLLFGVLLSYPSREHIKVTCPFGPRIVELESLCSCTRYFLHYLLISWWYHENSVGNPI